MTTDLDALEALEQAATPGEWRVDFDVVMLGAAVMGESQAICSASPPDAALIAEMRNALPELIERVREAEGTHPVGTVLPNYEWRWKKSEEHKVELREKLKAANTRAEAAEARVKELEAEVDRWENRMWASVAERMTWQHTVGEHADSPHPYLGCPICERDTAHSDLAALEAGIRAQVDEWERDRDVCLAWINDESMHIDADHPHRLSDLADRLNRSTEALRALLPKDGE